jgi:predicted transcriptional regulator
MGVKKKEVEGLTGLGPLEKDILEVLWDKGKLRVRDIFDILKVDKKVAHTSVAVLLDRLHQKNLVTREIETCRGGYRYIYTPISNKEEFQKKIMQGAIDKLISQFGTAAVSYFDERFGRTHKRGVKK